MRTPNSKLTNKAVRKTRTKKGIATMTTSLKYTISAIVIVCAVALGVLAAMGPKLGLQTPPIEAKAMQYIEEHNLLKADEKLEGYKATSYYSYKDGIVITNKRVFVFVDGKTVHSIALDKISLVVIKDTDLGHQEVVIAADVNGVIGFELYHTYVPKLIKMLHVKEAEIKFYTKQTAKKDAEASEKTTEKAVMTNSAGKI